MDSSEQSEQPPSYRAPISSNVPSYTRDANLSRLSGSNRLEDMRHEGTEIVNPVAARTDQDNGDCMRREILLKLEVLVHRDEHLKLACCLPKKSAVFQARTATTDDSLRIER